MENLTLDQISEIISALQYGKFAVKNLDCDMPEWNNKIESAIELMLAAEKNEIQKKYNLD